MLKPIHDNILLKELKQVSSQGIYMPTVQDIFYEILAIGNMVEGLQVGNKVLLGNEESKTIIISGTAYFITQEKNILAILED